MSVLPEVVGRYRVLGLLGRGAMGVVLRAHDPLIDRTVAIKLVRAELLEDPDGAEHLARFRREAQAAGRCVHPNIVALHDLSTHEGAPFLVMEHVDGPSLAQAARGRVLPPGEAAGLMLQVLDALGCAHAMGVVHRDVKPANVLLTAQGRVKVTDFGISRLASSDMTRAGSVIGTPAYMSPEQCRGEEVGAASDLFSVTTVLHELLAGRKPFPSDSLAALSGALLAGTPPAPPEGLAPALAAVLARGHAAAAADRFPDAAAMAAALRDALDGMTDEGRTVLLPSPTRAAAPDGPALDPAVVQSLEATLARYVGPLARHLVRNAAPGAGSPEALRATLALSIEGEEQRGRFLRDSGLHGEPAAPAAPRDESSRGAAATRGPGTLPAEALEEVARELARHVGPLARVLVRRAAATAPSLAALRETLAVQIADPAAQAAFRRG